MNSTVKKRTVLRFKNGQMESVEDKIVTGVSSDYEN